MLTMTLPRSHRIFDPELVWAGVSQQVLEDTLELPHETIVKILAEPARQYLRLETSVQLCGYRTASIY
jgi:hypothetical protein